MLSIKHKAKEALNLFLKKKNFIKQKEINDG